MSYFSDFPLKDNSSGSMNIDNRKMLSLKVISLSLQSNSKHALINGFLNEDINLLLSGNRLKIEAQGMDGSILEDQFSLMGFTKSFNYLLSTCN